MLQNRELMNKITAVNHELDLKSPIEFVRQMASQPNFDSWRGAPTAIIISGDGGDYATADCANATQNMAVAANSLGLGSCYMAGFKAALLHPDHKDFVQALGIPEGYIPIFALAVGYSNEVLEPRAPRKREQYKLCEMSLQQTYTYSKSDFDDNGFNSAKRFFLDVVRDWEEEFKKEYHVFANHLIANSSTMGLFKLCLMTNDNEDFGRDSEIDFETDLEIEAHSGRQTIYALGSNIEGNNNPLFLIRDNDVLDGAVILEYVIDDEDITQEKYEYNINDFDENGFNRMNDNLIIDFINTCEEDFHKRFHPQIAYNIIVNPATMNMIENCHLIAQNEGIQRYGEMLIL